MTPKQLQEHIYQTYWWLRIGLFVLAIAFPFLLWGVGRLNDIHLQDSMSEYYFAFNPHESPLRIFPVRVVFVGILFALGVALILYKGLSKPEDYLLNTAGIFALVAALCPMTTPDWCTYCGSNPWAYLHEWAGYIVFVCLGSVALFCTNSTLKKLPASKQRWKNWFLTGYIVIGALMIGLPIIVKTSGMLRQWLFVVESILLVLFAIYWAVRSWELWLSQLEWKAITGQDQT